MRLPVTDSRHMQLISHILDMTQLVTMSRCCDDALVDAHPDGLWELFFQECHCAINRWAPVATRFGIQVVVGWSRNVKRTLHVPGNFLASALQYQLGYLLAGASVIVVACV